MWVSLKRMEEEDLIFMNSIRCFSYFWSFKRFPGHQQKLSNMLGTLQTHGTLGKVTCKGAPVAYRHWQASAPEDSG